MKKILALMAIAGLATSAQATVITYDFETDQSGSFTLVEAGGPDSSADFQYDYSTHVQDALHTNVPIPAAPNSASTTIGVRVAVNEFANAVNGLTLYPDVSTAAAEFADGNWTMTFDVWANHNGDSGGASGSTEYWAFGAAADATQPGALSGNGTLDGYSYNITGDGGSGSDYIYTQGAGTQTREDVIAGWWGDGANNVNNAATAWSDFFLNDGTLGTAPTGSVLVGASGKQWITVELKSTAGGSTRTVSFKRPGDAAFTQVAQTFGSGASNQPFIGYSDIFASLANPFADNFVVFDNIVLDGEGVFVVSDAEAWNLYK